VPWISLPGIGEIVGGSQREEVLMLVEKMKALGIDEEELWWYLDTEDSISSSFWFWTGI
jgi:asparaginyl-tRNA synthetase